MQIKTYNLNQVSQLQQLTSSGGKAYQSEEKEINGDVSISYAGRQAEKNWLSIAGEYDVTNITDNERIAMTNDLLNGKLISPEEGLSLIAPISMNHDNNEKVNYLNIQERNLNFSKSNGASHEQIDLLQRTVDILKKIHTLV